MRISHKDADLLAQQQSKTVADLRREIKWLERHIAIRKAALAQRGLKK